MQFLNPGMLAVLSLIPILLLIHTLKPKPRQVDVTNPFSVAGSIKGKKQPVDLRSP